MHTVQETSQVSESRIQSGVSISAIKDWPIPNNVKSVQFFVGLASYFRKLILNCDKIAKPLHKLIEKHTKFVLSEECNQTFEILKQA